MTGRSEPAAAEEKATNQRMEGERAKGGELTDGRAGRTEQRFQAQRAHGGQGGSRFGHKRPPCQASSSMVIYYYDGFGFPLNHLPPTPPPPSPPPTALYRYRSSHQLSCSLSTQLHDPPVTYHIPYQPWYVPPSSLSRPVALKIPHFAGQICLAFSTGLLTSHRLGRLSDRRASF